MEFLTIHQQDTMIQAFVTGEHAKAMENLPEETVKQHLVWHLENITGVKVPPPTFFRRLVTDSALEGSSDILEVHKKK